MKPAHFPLSALWTKARVVSRTEEAAYFEPCFSVLFPAHSPGEIPSSAGKPGRHNWRPSRCQKTLSDLASAAGQRAPASTAVSIDCLKGTSERSRPGILPGNSVT